MFLAHAPISFLGNELIQRKSIAKLKQNEKVLVGIAALLFGIMPDIDILILVGAGLPSFIHHTIISHTPIFYILLWLLLKLIYWIVKRWFSKPVSKFLNPEFVNVLLNTFLIATLLHLLADLFAEDIMLLYPFTTQNFTLLKYVLEPNMFGGYFLSITFGVETLITGIFGAYLLNRLFKKSVIHMILNIILIVPATLFFCMNAYAHFNAYNSSILRDDEEQANVDIDGDSVFDSYDMDVDNDGKDNVIDIDLKELVAQVKVILESNKWTANSDATSLSGKFKYEYGGLSSFRLLSQAYADIHSPINPVLRNMLTENGSIERYSFEYDSQAALFEYFASKNILVELDQNSEDALTKGAIFFAIDSDGEVLNMGIVVDSESVGTVLPYDERLKTHTFNEFTNYYGDDTKIMITR